VRYEIPAGPELREAAPFEAHIRWENPAHCLPQIRPRQGHTPGGGRSSPLKTAMAFRRLSPDLFFRVRSALERHGYCILGGDEIQRLLASSASSRAARGRIIQQFAKACGAVVETTPHFTSARFVKARER
jgi:hypothetical protein